MLRFFTSVIICLTVLISKSDAQTMDSTFFKKVITMDHRSDSLEIIVDQLLNYTGSDSLYRSACFEVCRKLNGVKKYEQGVSFVKKMMRTEYFAADENFHGKMNYFLAWFYFRLRQDAPCLSASTEAIAKLRATKDTALLVMAYSNAAIYHSVQGEIRTALDTLRSGEPILYGSEAAMKKSGFFYFKALHSAYFKLNDFETAVEYGKKALRLSAFQSRLWNNSMYSIALSYSTINKDSSKFYMDQLIASEELKNYPNQYQSAHKLKLNELIESNQVSEAEDLLLHLVDYGKENKYELDEHVISQKMALIKYQMKDYLAASQHYKNAFDAFNKDSQDRGAGGNFENGLLVGYLKSKFNSQRDTTSVNYLNRVIENEEKIRETIVADELEDFKVQFNTNEKERENELLKNQKSLLEKNNTLQRMFLFGSILLISIISFLTYRLFGRNKKQKQLNQTLSTQRDQIQILNRELNHRVKNNLAFMTSLLEMQGRRTDNTETKQILQESESRLKALSIVHNNLFQNESNTTINLKNYLEEILTHLQNIFEIPGKTLTVEKHLANIDFDAEDAMRVGLVVNELVTNSVKHAFADVDTPKIILETTQSPDGKIALRYKDNGPGYIQKDLQSSSNTTTSIGIKLIQLLEQQLIEKLDLQLT